MIRRWFILGILVLLMVSLLWNFYREVVVYNAMDAVQKTETVAHKTKKETPEYSPAWNEGIVNNNLFSKDRGYVAPVVITNTPAPVIPEPVQPPPNLNLNGIILNQYGEYIALIQVDGAPAKRAMKGDEISGALVVDISAREVKLLWNEEEITLSMKKIKTVPMTK